MVPIALLAGRRWRAIAAAAVTAGVLLGLSWLVFGPELWAHYFRNLAALRAAILEDEISPRMVSVYVAARSFGASVKAAYWMQGIVGVTAAIAVAAAWCKRTPAYLRNALVLLGTCLAVPYLQDYDLVFGAMAVVWLWHQPVESLRAERMVQIASGLLLFVPLVAAALFHMTGGLSLGTFFIIPAFIVAVQMSFSAHPAVLATASAPHTS